MTEQKKEETKEIPQRSIFMEYRGKYILIDNNKSYAFDYPSQNNIYQNYDIICLLKDQIWEAIQNMEKKKKEEEDKKAKEKIVEIKKEVK